MNKEPLTSHQKNILKKMSQRQSTIIQYQSRYGMDLDKIPGYDDGEGKKENNN